MLNLERGHCNGPDGDVWYNDIPGNNEIPRGRSRLPISQSKSVQCENWFTSLQHEIDRCIEANYAREPCVHTVVTGKGSA